MPGLNIAVLVDDAERLRGALTLALAHVALGGSARLFLQLDAVRMLQSPIRAPRDADHVSHGLPSLADLIGEALETGIEIIACQSGLALAGLALSDLDPRIVAGGPVSFLQASGAGDRLLIL
ncbi:MAG: DsrE family protein [Sphingobium sp.]